MTTGDNVTAGNKNSGWSISGPGECSPADPLGQMCRLWYNGEHICLLQECGEMDYDTRYIEEPHEEEEPMIRVKLDEGV